ncbi:MAG: long-chain fatty acid--CoA ligase [Actinomycetota bacterium]
MRIIDPTNGLRVPSEQPPFPVGPSSIAELWDRRPPDSVAVVDGERSWTTDELRSEVDRVARCLIAAGALPGDRIGWVVGDDVTSLVSLLATLRINGWWAGVSSRAPEAERRALLDGIEPALVLDTLPQGDPTIALPVAGGGAIAFTSGTTGRPKAVVHGEQQLLYPAAAAIETERLDEHSRIGTPLSLATLNIVLLGPLTALACGGTAVLLPRRDPEGLSADIARHRVTRVLAVPTIVHDLAAAPVEPDRLATVHRIVLGGAGVDRERARAAERTLGVRLVLSYGLSEAPTGVARMGLDETGAAPLPGVSIELDDGEITLAPTIDGAWAGCWQGTLGYWRDPEATAELWRDGRLHTGDAGQLDPDGRLLVTGRVGDMINRGGATIAPTEVESTLLSLDGVIDAAVFGVDDERLGQVVAAAVVGDVEPDVLRPLVRARLSGYKVPERWLVLDDLPRNANGKVDRNELRARLDA